MMCDHCRKLIEGRHVGLSHNNGKSFYCRFHWKCYEELGTKLTYRQRSKETWACGSPKKVTKE